MDYCGHSRENGAGSRLPFLPALFLTMRPAFILFALLLACACAAWAAEPVAAKEAKPQRPASGPEAELKFLGQGEWMEVEMSEIKKAGAWPLTECCADSEGVVYLTGNSMARRLIRIADEVTVERLHDAWTSDFRMRIMMTVQRVTPIASPSMLLVPSCAYVPGITHAPIHQDARLLIYPEDVGPVVVTHDSQVICMLLGGPIIFPLEEGLAKAKLMIDKLPIAIAEFATEALCLSPDQTQLYITGSEYEDIIVYSKDVDASQVAKAKLGLKKGDIMIAKVTPEGVHKPVQWAKTQGLAPATGLSVDTEGHLYAATPTGIHVFDAAGQLQIIIPTPQPAHDVCFGGKGLHELFITCGDAIYRRPTRMTGVVSGQQAPIRSAAEKQQ